MSIYNVNEYLYFKILRSYKLIQKIIIKWTYICRMGGLINCLNKWPASYVNLSGAPQLDLCSYNWYKIGLDATGGPECPKSQPI